MNVKICTRCLASKDLNQFRFLNKSKGVKHPTCNTCTKLKVPAIKIDMPDHLSNEQLEIFNGSMLGDGCIPKEPSPTYNCHYDVLRCTRDKEYLQWHGAKFHNFSKPSNIKDGETFDKRTSKTYYWSKFRTRSSPVFTKMRQSWYPKDTKIVPNTLELTPLTVAVWFCDDGCISTTTKGNLRCCFATDSFIKKDVELLQFKLTETVKSKFTISKHEEGYVIYGASETTEALVSYMNAFIPTSMSRKLTHYSV